MPLILVLDEVGGVHKVELACKRAYGEVAVERHLNLTFLGRLGGDDNYTVTTLGTVNGCKGGILENVDRSDVRRRDIVDVICLETIDNIKRFVTLGH